jgi:hypothetical protein
MNKFSIILVFTCSILAIYPNAYTVFGLNPENPKIGSAILDVSPLTQGVHGDLAIQTFVRINGTC